MTRRLAEMRWPEIEAELDAGTRLVVVPTASIEQHGPGLPLNVDTLRGDALGERIADALDCFVAPTIRPGISEHHMGFSGTISIRPETFRNVVYDYCTSLASHGFEDIALMTTHGGNTDMLEDVSTEADADVDANVFVAGDREGFIETRYGAMASHDVDTDAAGQHAGAAETSFIQEIRPDLVADDELAVGHLGAVDGDRLVEEGTEAVTDNGVLGDQTAATRTAGRTLINECVDHYVAEIKAELTE